MGRIGIIGALDEEVELYLEKIGVKSKKTIAGFDFYFGKLGGKDVVVTKCGVGKVNASSCTQTMINKFSVSYIIFTGVAGALHPALDLNTIVISTESIQHDIDGRGLGFELGMVPFSNQKRFPASKCLIQIASSNAKQIGLTYTEGVILSGDQFISNAKIRKNLRETFQGLCVDMESAAVAHVCSINDVPHVVIRSISDKADTSASQDFAATCKTAAMNSAKLVERIIADIKTDDKMQKLNEIKTKIRTVPHWPKQGIMFRDVTTLLKDRHGFKHVIDLLAERYENYELDTIVGIDARGFIFGAALADRLGVGFIPVRKAGKLPSNTISEEYSLEYGKEKMEIHVDALTKGERVLLIDDLLATGGTALAACKLIEKLGGKLVECCFVVCLPELGGAKKLDEAGYSIFHLIDFEGE